MATPPYEKYATFACLMSLYLCAPVYQPTAEELRKDLRLKGTFEDAVKALLRPVSMRKVMPPKSR